MSAQCPAGLTRSGFSTDDDALVLAIADHVRISFVSQTEDVRAQLVVLFAFVLADASVRVQRTDHLQTQAQRQQRACSQRHALTQVLHARSSSQIQCEWPLRVTAAAAEQAQRVAARHCVALLTLNGLMAMSTEAMFV